MIMAQSNTSRILHKPSHGREGFGLARLQVRSISGRFGESLTNPSRVGVKDLGGRKSIYSKYISLSFLYTSRCHAHARALRVRTCEGVCDGFRGRIRCASPVQQCLTLRPRSHTLAHVGVVVERWPVRPLLARTRTCATRWPTCDLPLWQANRYSAKKVRGDWPVGTGPRLSTVCFRCPTRNQDPIQKG